jgi:predicted ester cyclase
VFNGHNASATSDYFSSGVQWHGGTLGTIEGSDAMTSFYGELFAALPDLEVTTVGIAADEDTVWCRFVIEGTNQSSLFGFPATGNPVRWDEIDAYRVTGGKIVEEWSSPDMDKHSLSARGLHPPVAFLSPMVISTAISTHATELGLALATSGIGRGKTTLLERRAQVEEIAEVIAFLASDSASYLARAVSIGRSPTREGNTA